MFDRTISSNCLHMIDDLNPDADVAGEEPAEDDMPVVPDAEE
jgi:hypothetical protein